MSTSHDEHRRQGKHEKARGEHGFQLVDGVNDLLD